MNDSHRGCGSRFAGFHGGHNKLGWLLWGFAYMQGFTPPNWLRLLFRFSWGVFFWLARGNCLLCGPSSCSKSKSTLWVFDYQSGLPLGHHQLFWWRASGNVSEVEPSGSMKKAEQRRRATIAIISGWFKTTSNHHYRCRRRRCRLLILSIALGEIPRGILSI